MSNEARDEHVVVEGDRISSIAAKYNYATIDAVLQDPRNAALRDKKKRNPEMLMPGEKVYLPPRADKPQPVSEKQTNTLTVAAIPSRVKLKLQVAGAPLDAQALKWKLGHDPYPGDARAGTDWIPGAVKAGGLVEFDVPPSATEAVVYLPELKCEFLLKIGHLHPHLTPSGMQQRLNSLGFYCPVSPPGQSPALAGAASKQQQHAIRRFEECHGLTPAGAATDAVKEKLRALHELP